MRQKAETIPSSLTYGMLLILPLGGGRRNAPRLAIVHVGAALAGSRGPGGPAPGPPCNPTPRGVIEQALEQPLRIDKAQFTPRICHA